MPAARGRRSRHLRALEGTVAQEDSKGWSGVLQTGEIQLMTTDRWVRHAERNASEVDGAHLCQISVRPAELELPFARVQHLLSVSDRRNVLRAVASSDGCRGSLRVHQDALVYSSIVDPGRHMVRDLRPGRVAWLHIVRGEATFDGLVLAAGDGVGVTAEPVISFIAREETEILLIEVAGPPAKRPRRSTRAPTEAGEEARGLR